MGQSIVENRIFKLLLLLINTKMIDFELNPIFLNKISTSSITLFGLFFIKWAKKKNALLFKNKIIYPLKKNDSTTNWIGV